MVITSAYFSRSIGGVERIASMETPCCPDCGRRLRFQGRCKRIAKTADAPEGKRFSLRVLFCKECRRTHRELPDFIVPNKNYSYDYMCAVACGAEVPPDDRSRTRITQWLCKIVLLAMQLLEDAALRTMSELVAENDFLRELTLMAKNLYAKLEKCENKSSIKMEFTRSEKHVILRAIQSKGVTSADAGTMDGRNGKQWQST